MLDNPTLHYTPNMLGLATDNHEYGGVLLQPEEQVIFLWNAEADELGWLVWDGLLSVEESARAFDDLRLVVEEVAIG